MKTISHPAINNGLFTSSSQDSHIPVEYKCWKEHPRGILQVYLVVKVSVRISITKRKLYRLFLDCDGKKYDE
jgi:hypothetical protein